MMTPEAWLIRLALGVSVVFLLCTVGFYVFLAVRKWRLNRKKVRLRKLLESLGAADSSMMRYLADGERSRHMYPRKAERLLALETFLADRLKTANNREEQMRIYHLAEELFAETYRFRLKARRWGTRINTLLFTELFRISSLQNDVQQLLEQKRTTAEETAIALRILAGFDYAEMAPLLLKQDGLLSGHVYRHVLLAMPPERLEALVPLYDRLHGELSLHLLDVLRIRNLRTQPVLTLLEGQVLGEDRERRIRAMKALANFGYMSPEAEEALYLRFLSWRDMEWPERLMAAKLMGSLRAERYVLLLEGLMGDPVYMVRVQAVQSIMLYRNGVDHMRRVAFAHPDRYARELAEETLERSAYERNVT